MADERQDTRYQQPSGRFIIDIHHHFDPGTTLPFAGNATVLEAVASLSQKVIAMSESTGTQLDTISAGIEAIAVDMGEIQAEIAALKGSQTLSPADAAKIAALESRVAVVRTAMDNLAAPPANPNVPPPVVTTNPDGTITTVTTNPDGTTTTLITNADGSPVTIPPIPAAAAARA